MRIDGRQTVRWIGNVLLVLSLVFVLIKMWNNRETILQLRWGGGLAAMFLTAVLVYWLSNFLLSSSWHRLLYWSGDSSISPAENFRIYARTQIAKYIPGKIFQVASRYLLTHARGTSHGQLTAATFLEMAGVLTASSFIALGAILLAGHDVKEIYKAGVAVVFVSTVLAPVVVSRVAARLSPFGELGVTLKQIRIVPSGLFQVYLRYVLFFVASGLVFYMLLKTIAVIPGCQHAGLVVSVYSLSWLVGFVIPGAPGGLGVREAVVVGLLAKTVGEPQSLCAAFLFRFATVLGDLLFFLCSFTSFGAQGGPAGNRGDESCSPPEPGVR